MGEEKSDKIKSVKKGQGTKKKKRRRKKRGDASKVIQIKSSELLHLSDWLKETATSAGRGWNSK